MAQSKYVLQLSEKSHCPHCNAVVYLLANDRTPRAWFYICFGCKSVFEVGVGECKHER